MSNQNKQIETLESAARIMASRKKITAPGKYHVKVENDPQKLAEDGTVHKELAGGSFQVSIANFKAATPYHLQKFKEFAREGDYQAAVNNKLTASIRDVDYMPSKKEIVEINVDYVTTKSGEQALFVTSCNPLPVSAGSSFDINSLLSLEDDEDSIAIETEEDLQAEAEAQPQFKA